jgi:iron complex outermembrane receptor protein
MKRTLLFAVCAFACMAASAQTPTPPAKMAETIQVTAEKIPEDVLNVPGHVTVVDGDELRARNATDLQSALALASGVSIAPGGDGGPAGSVPELWGLREFDAFLLVVDGVPWGGAFNPDLPTVDLTDVDRIEVVRGSSPVMYGATSFVGVIHVIHRQPGAPGIGRVSGGSYGSASVAASVPLSQSGNVLQSISANADRKRFRDDDTGFDRFHALYRATSSTAGGVWRFDADYAGIRQDPNSPHVREGRALTSITPVDANYNPAGAKIDQDRFHVVGGYDAKLGGTPWTSTLAISHSTFDIKRGFLVDLAGSDPNAFGFTQDRNVTDVYIDTHVVRTFSPTLRMIAGFDHLYGKGHATSATFDYFAPLAGGRGVRSSEVLAEEFDAKDTRNFSGLYASSQWTAAPGLMFDLGLRLNRTNEKRDNDGPDGPEKESRSFTRLSGSLGLDYKVLDSLSFFADYRNTFKPAAIDFGPEAEVEILKPETAQSYELGLKGRGDEGRLTWTTSLFLMDFRNLITAATVDNTPILQNAGRERFKGGELEVEYAWRPSWRAQFGTSYHDARFRHFVQEFDPGVPTQLAGKRLEMSPHNLGGAGVLFLPATGFNFTAAVNYVGKRWLNKRNTAPAKAYTTWSAGVGYRIAKSELRFDGRNLNNSRAPVAESELGDAQYYLLPARSLEVSYRYWF